MEYIYIGTVIVFVIALLVVAKVMDEEDINAEKKEEQWKGFWSF